jgi:CheY-like chemotaxis protein
MGLKVMVVDDNQDIRFTIKDSLTAIDNTYQFVEASSGEECLKLLGQNKPDVILMDIMMPGMDGTETAIKIKEDSNFKNIPLIFLTAKTDKLSKEMGAIVGQDFVEKPFDPADLDKRIKAAKK